MKSSNSSTCSKGEGNTKPPPSKQISPAKAWCWTLNNYTTEEIDYLVPKFQELCDIAFFAEEIGESGTPHLQGYIKLKVKARPTSKFTLCNRIHWEKSKGNLEANIIIVLRRINFFFLSVYQDLSNLFPKKLCILTKKG